MNDIHVKMCELRLGAAPQVLRTTLGSCVGIGLLWRERGRCALAHCLLPASPVPSGQLSAKYVTDAVPSLLKLLGVAPTQHGQIEAVIAGGACMVKQVNPAPYGLIGEQNTRMAQQLLAQTGIRIVHTDVGGTYGRQLTIDCSSQLYSVRNFERIN